MRNRRTLILALAVLLLALTLASPVAAVGEVAYVRFHSVQDINWPVDFSDEYLAGSGQTYRQAMAQASLGMALSAFRVPGVELSQRGDSIETYLTELGFTNISLSQYDVEPTIQTIATAISMKALTDETGAFTVLAVAISGGGYQDEWKSNFLIGNGLHHEGFNAAAEKVTGRIEDYLERQKIDGRVKIWLTGYSRAAATANRAAAILLDERLVTSDNLFCYTFATPNVTRQSNAASYPSIFNVIGSFDPVPMIPFEDWGYTRYGVTRYLPTPEANSDYAVRVAPVKALYREMTGSEYWTNQSDNRLIQKVFGVLTDMVSNIDDYAQHYQSLLIDLWSNKSNPVALITGLAQTLAGDQTLWQQLSGEADKALSIVSNTAGEALLQDVGLFEQSWSANADLGENLMHEHYPKGYLAWLCAYQDVDAMVSHNRNYRQLTVGGDAGITVYNATGEVACAFDVTDGVTTPQTGASSLTIAQSGDALTVSIPADEAYRVEIRAHDGDPIEVVIREGTIGKTALVSYQPTSQTLPTHVVYTCALPSAFYASGTRYTPRLGRWRSSLRAYEQQLDAQQAGSQQHCQAAFKRQPDNADPHGCNAAVTVAFLHRDRASRAEGAPEKGAHAKNAPRFPAGR